ncbi:PTS fructose transporter subunit IIC [Erysipelotrichaceae bacterium]|nr:PTS fructose transporter subunit IIC [Erysipelotrichaceae bacterium]
MKNKIQEARIHLMSGISYILPVIIAGSLVVAVAKITGMAFGVSDLDLFADKTGFLHYLYLLQGVGWTAIGMMNLLLGGFIAYSIAGKPGLAAGFVGGALASSTNAGFLGAVLAGFFAGWITNQVKNKVKITGPAAGMLPLIILPLITVGLTGLLMGVILGAPLGLINTSLIDWVMLMSENTTNMIILAAVLGAMIGFDLGGPVNKAAWMAGNALYLSGVYLPAIMINIAICIPPLGYGIATLIRKNNYSQTLKEAGLGALVMGVIGITEGAIPFTLSHPVKLIPLNVIACSSGAMLAIALGVYDIMPPIGGMYGFFTIGNGWAYLVGGIAGAFIIAIGANILCDFTEKTQSAEQQQAEIDEIELIFD